jgi:hypothetical protein
MPKVTPNTDIVLSEVESLTILETITAAYNYFWLQDMSESYVKLNRQNRSSPITLSLESIMSLLNERINGDESVPQE